MIEPKKNPKTGLWEARPEIAGRRIRLRATTKKKLLDDYYEAKDTRRREKLGLVEPVTPADLDLTYRALVKRCLDAYPQKPQSRRALEDRLKHSLKAFSDALVRDLSRETIQKWVNNLTALNDPTKPLKPTSRAGALKAMRQVLRWGVEEGITTTRNPASGVKAPTSDGDSARPFKSWDQVTAVANAIGDRHRPLVQFWAATGLRPEEIIVLRWSDIRLGDRPAVTVNRTMQDGAIVENVAKNDGSLRTIRLTPLAVEAQASLPQPIDREQLVFPGVQGGTIDLAAFRRGPWRKALEATGLDYRPPKHLRHTFATLALSGGVRIEAVSRILGHKDVTTTARYYARWTDKGDDHIVEELAATMPRSLRPKPSTDTESEAEAK